MCLHSGLPLATIMPPRTDESLHNVQLPEGEFLKGILPDILRQLGAGSSSFPQQIINMGMQGVLSCIVDALGLLLHTPQLRATGLWLRHSPVQSSQVNLACLREKQVIPFCS